MIINFPKNAKDAIAVAGETQDFVSAIALLRMQNSPEADLEIAKILIDNDLFEVASDILFALKFNAYKHPQLAILIRLCGLCKLGLDKDEAMEIAQTLGAEEPTQEANSDLELFSNFLFDSVEESYDKRCYEEDFSVVPKEKGIIHLEDEQFFNFLTDNLTKKNCMDSRERIRQNLDRYCKNFDYLAVCYCVFSQVTQIKCAKKDEETYRQLLCAIDNCNGQDMKFESLVSLAMALAERGEHLRAHRFFTLLDGEPNVMRYSPMYLLIFQSLYNVGKKAEARSLIYKMNTIFPNVVNKYYLNNFNKLGKTVEYTLDLPQKVADSYHKKLFSITNWTTATKSVSNMKVINWALRDYLELREISYYTATQLIMHFSPANYDYLQSLLVKAQFDPDVKAIIITAFMLIDMPRIALVTRSRQFCYIKKILPDKLKYETARAIAKIYPRLALDDETIDKMVIRATQLADALGDASISDELSCALTCIIAEETEYWDIYELFGCPKKKVKEIYLLLSQ